jgi:hypothetical protein
LLVFLYLKEQNVRLPARPERDSTESLYEPQPANSGVTSNWQARPRPISAGQHTGRPSNPARG